VSESLTESLSRLGVRHHHVGFVERSIDDRTLGRWFSVGFRVSGSLVRDPDLGVKCCLLISPWGSPVELVSPLSADAPGPVNSRLRRGGGLDHLAIQVLDFPYAIDLFRHHGYRKISHQKRAMLFDEDVVFFSCGTGLMLELVSAEHGFAPWAVSKSDEVVIPFEL
jgi:methylmalonyl-CoA/ethylmalonyl-CoA epimerase